VNFLSFNRMNVYRRNGRIALVLKISLPQIPGDDATSSSFNKFYQELADSLFLWCKSFRLPINFSSPIRITVSFCEPSDDDMRRVKKRMREGQCFVFVLRETVINFDGAIQKERSLDVYDTEHDIFVK